MSAHLAHLELSVCQWKAGKAGKLRQLSQLYKVNCHESDKRSCRCRCCYVTGMKTRREEDRKEDEDEASVVVALIEEEGLRRRGKKGYLSGSDSVKVLPSSRLREGTS